MSKTITIDDDVYELLSSLKEGPGDSLTKVLRRNVHKPIEVCGELLDACEQNPPPQTADLDIMKRIARERGRRSGGRK